jgi:hypothetical protein
MLADALREMTEWLLEDGQALPAPTPGVADDHADVVEPILLVIRARPGAASP